MIIRDCEAFLAVIFSETLKVFDFLIFGYYVCFFKMQKVQYPTQSPSYQTPSAKFLLKIQLTHDNLGTKSSEKMKISRILGLAYNFKLLYAY